MLKLFAFIRALFSVPKADQSQCTTIRSAQDDSPFCKTERRDGEHIQLLNERELMIHEIISGVS